MPIKGELLEKVQMVNDFCFNGVGRKSHMPPWSPVTDTEMDLLKAAVRSYIAMLRGRLDSKNSNKSVSVKKTAPKRKFHAKRQKK